MGLALRGVEPMEATGVSVSAGVRRRSFGASELSQPTERYGIRLSVSGRGNGQVRLQRSQARGRSASLAKKGLSAVPDGSSARMDTLSHAEGKKATLKKDVSQIRAMLTCLQKSRSI